MLSLQFLSIFIDANFLFPGILRQKQINKVIKILILILHRSKSTLGKFLHCNSLRYKVLVSFWTLDRSQVTEFGWTQAPKLFGWVEEKIIVLVEIILVPHGKTNSGLLCENSISPIHQPRPIATSSPHGLCRSSHYICPLLRSLSTPAGTTPSYMRVLYLFRLKGEHWHGIL